MLYKNGLKPDPPKRWGSFWGNKDGPTACFTLLPIEVSNHYQYYLEQKFHGCYLTHNHFHSGVHNCSTLKIHIDSYNVEQLLGNKHRTFQSSYIYMDYIK